MEKCGIVFSSTPTSLLLAVSGGVDSAVMLHALHILSQHSAAENAADKNKACTRSFLLSVITVNHNIRPAEQSEADALCVQKYCAQLGVSCTVKTVPPGEIVSVAAQRKAGLEEAARFVRYDLLEKEARAQNADFVLLAHNRDDQLETLLQRFFQGAAAGISGNASAGIARRRGVFCRPLLDIRRSQIEAYAHEYAVPFCTDATNTDLAYYRNNMRLRIIPFLNKYLPGWDTGVLCGAQKAAETNACIDAFAKDIVWEPVFTVCTDKTAVRQPMHCLRTCSGRFFDAPFAVRIRALYTALERIGVRGRIPYEPLKAFAGGQRRVSGCGIELRVVKQFVFMQKVCAQKNSTEKELPFCIKIEKPGTYGLPFGTVDVVAASSLRVRKRQNPAENKYGNMCAGPFMLPVTLRGALAGERIQTADGKHKTLKKIRNEWGVLPPHKSLLPVIERDGSPVCIWGAPLGYPVWYVKDCAGNGTADNTVLFMFEHL